MQAMAARVMAAQSLGWRRRFGWRRSRLVLGCEVLAPGHAHHPRDEQVELAGETTASARRRRRGRLVIDLFLGHLGSRDDACQFACPWQTGRVAKSVR